MSGAAKSERADFVNGLRDYLGLVPLPDLFDSHGLNCAACDRDACGTCLAHRIERHRGQRIDLGKV